MSETRTAQGSIPLEIPQKSQSLANLFDYPCFDAEFEEDRENFEDEIIFFDRQYLLIDGTDGRIDLIITDDPDSPTLSQMLLNGMSGETLYSILDSNGQHIPMVRDVEALLTATNPVIASAFKNIQTWNDLKSYGIELDVENGILKLQGWHIATTGKFNHINEHSGNFYTTTYENDNGMRLETSLKHTITSNIDYVLKSHAQHGHDDFHDVITHFQQRHR